VPLSLRRAKKSASAFWASARFSERIYVTRVIHDMTGTRTLSEDFEEFSESLFPLAIISSPAVKPSVLLELSPEIGPTYPCAFHLRRKEFFELFLGIFLFLNTRCSKFACTFSTVFVEGFATRRNGRKQHIARVRDEEGKRCVPWM
jgi:hypothetical protein